MTWTDLFRRRIAVPNEHGAWVLFLGPLIIGIVAGGRLTIPTTYLVVAALAGFMLRQPITALAKVRGGRRPATDVPAAWFWIVVYTAVAALHVGGLVIRGFGYVLYLALPGIPVFAWYVHLVMHRAERRQLAIELLATGALSLSAPAAMWIGRGTPDPRGWLLWVLVWSGYAGAVVYTYLRLVQRTWREPRDTRMQLRAGRLALGLAGSSVALVGVLAALGIVSPWLLVPFGVQLLECLKGTLRPAVGWRPRRIGLRQLAVSAVFTVTFAWAWTQGG